MSHKTNLDVVFGAMTFGREGVEQVRTSKLEDCVAILDTFQSYNHSEIDTSRFYGDGTSEEYLASLEWKKRGLIMDTKYFPNVHGLFGRQETHSSYADMSKGLNDSLKALNTDSVDLWYLHGPDRTINLEETLKGVNELHKQGKFKTWGISNFMAWEVAALCEICLQHTYPLPTVYQGVYNALHRTIEHELLPCLRKYNIAFYAYNPLAGGWLTSRYRRDTASSTIEPGSRFDENRMQGKMYRARYWNDGFFSALEGLRGALGKDGDGDGDGKSGDGETRESEVALRWMMWHSQLKREYGDKVIIGASSKEQLEMNLGDFEKGRLGQEVLEALDRGWEGCRGVAWKYFH